MHAFDEFQNVFRAWALASRSQRETSMGKYDAATGLMDFSLALTSLKRGGRVARAIWPTGTFLQVINGTIRFVRNGEQLHYVAPQADLMADDWEELV